MHESEIKTSWFGLDPGDFESENLNEHFFHQLRPGSDAVLFMSRT